jgi:peptidoglycan DL-endopeptidase CwlO
VLTKDDAVPTKPVSLRSALTRRAAAVAGSAAAAALFATIPASPAAAPAVPSPSPTAVVTTPVVRLAAARPAAITLNPQAVAAAVRTSAVQKALGKVGSRYRYGASGPNAFDCSGLVSWAFKNSGKSLPRTSKAMSRVGTPVSKSALQPGDLVFFYGGPSHVGIYVGGGKIVHASNPRHPVRVADMKSMPFHSARRV